MSKIPELMSGRALEHDIKFASDGPMSGPVHGVQSITCAGTTVLRLKETSVVNEVQMRSDMLAIDPGGAGRIVKLPPALTNGPSLAGRKIVIFNSASDSAVGGSGGGSGGELLQIQQSDATHICTLGFGDTAEITFIGQDTIVETKKLKKHTIALAQNDLKALTSAASIILPAIATVAYQVVSVKFVMSGTGMTNGAGNIDVLYGTATAIRSANTLITSAQTIYETAAASLNPTVNTTVSLKDDDANPTGGGGDSELLVTLFYYEI
tara:strand:+ start:1452 stop:2249 length:798 start_codon:yes stop_codon:yes gene_type:complete